MNIVKLIALVSLLAPAAHADEVVLRDANGLFQQYDVRPVYPWGTTIMDGMGIKRTIQLSTSGSSVTSSEVNCPVEYQPVLRSSGIPACARDVIDPK